MVYASKLKENTYSGDIGVLSCGTYRFNMVHGNIPSSLTEIPQRSLYIQESCEENWQESCEGNRQIIPKETIYPCNNSKTAKLMLKPHLDNNNTKYILCNYLLKLRYTLTLTRHNSLFEQEIVKLKEEFGTYVFKLLPLIFNKTILLIKKM